MCPCQYAILIEIKKEDELLIEEVYENKDFRGNKGFRLLNMYEQLNKGEGLVKSKLAVRFGVGEKTIQRDIDELRAYLAEMHYSEVDNILKYDRARNVYSLERLEREWFTNEEVLTIAKILLESRGLCKEEMDRLIDKLSLQVTPNSRSQWDDMISNEQHNYIEPRHKKTLIQDLWSLSSYIKSRSMISFVYYRQDGAERKHQVKPVSIMFSEYYFYLIAYLSDDSKDFPTVFRIDRMNDIRDTSEKFNIPYRDKFNEGEFRKRVQFMYGGQLKHVIFEYSGKSIEAILDRLPTAQVISEQEGVYRITAESYGNGIDMWLKSQGENVRILKK